LPHNAVGSVAGALRVTELVALIFDAGHLGGAFRLVSMPNSRPAANADRAHRRDGGADTLRGAVGIRSAPLETRPRRIGGKRGGREAQPGNTTLCANEAGSAGKHARTDAKGLGLPPHHDAFRLKRIREDACTKGVAPILRSRTKWIIDIEGAANLVAPR